MCGLLWVCVWICFGCFLVYVFLWFLCCFVIVCFLFWGCLEYLGIFLYVLVHVLILFVFIISVLLHCFMCSCDCFCFCVLVAFCCVYRAFVFCFFSFCCSCVFLCFLCFCVCVFSFVILRGIPQAGADWALHRLARLRAGLRPGTCRRAARGSRPSPFSCRNHRRPWKTAIS